MVDFLGVVSVSVVISRERIFDLILVWTSKSTDFTSTLLFLRAVVIVSR